MSLKRLRTNYDYDKLARYCSALENEGGGRIILGVTDKRPRRVVGSRAFPEPGHTVARLTRSLQFRIEFEEIRHTDGRVLVFTAPPHMLGVPVQYEGIYWARAGDELKVDAAGPTAGGIFDEAAPDFWPSFILKPAFRPRSRHYRTVPGNVAPKVGTMPH